MKNPILYLAYKTLKIRKITTIILIISIALCISLSIILVSVKNSYKLNYKTQLLNTYGVQHTILYNIPQETENILINNGNIETVGKVIICGIFKIPKSITNETLSLGHMDEVAISLSKIQLVEGRLPEKSNEVAIEKGALARMNIDPTIDMNIILDVELLQENKNLRRDTLKQTFVLVGILENYSANQLPEREKRVSGYIDLPSILLSNNNAITELQPFITKHYYLQYKSDVNPFQLIKKNQEIYQSGLIQLNTNVYNPENGKMLIKSVGTDLIPPLILIIITLFSAFFMLTNIIILSNNEGFSQIVNLRIIGGSNADLIKLIAIKSSLMIITALPIGFLITYPLYSIVRIILSKLTISFDLVLDFSNCSILLAITCVFVLFLFIRPVIKMKRYTVIELSGHVIKADRIQHVNFNSKNGIILWAIKSAVNDLNKNIMVCISLAIIVFIIISGTYIIRIMKYDNMPITQYDYWVNKTSKMYYSSLIIPDKSNYGIGENQLFYLATSPEVKSIYGIKRFDINIEQKIEDKDNKYLDLSPLPSYSGMENIVLEDKVKYGYEKSSTLFRERIISLNDEMLEILTPYIIDGNIDIGELKMGDKIIFCTNINNHQITEGDTFILSQIVNGYMFSKEVEIATVVLLPENRADLYKIYGKSFIWHHDAFGEVGLDVNYSDIRIELKDSTKSGDIKSRIHDVVSLNTDETNKMTVWSGIEENEIYRNTGRLTRLFIYIIVFIMGFYALINIISYFNLRIRERLQLYGVMRAIGMTKYQLISMIQIEAAHFALISVLLGVGLSILVFIAFHRIPAKGISVFNVIPYSSILITSTGLIIIVLLSVLLPVMQIFKQSEVDEIRSL